MATVDHASENRGQPQRQLTQARAITRFKWLTLSPIVAILWLSWYRHFLATIFLVFGWTVYLGSWWEAEFVGLELFEKF